MPYRVLLRKVDHFLESFFDDIASVFSDETVHDEFCGVEFEFSVAGVAHLVHQNVQTTIIGHDVTQGAANLITKARCLVKEVFFSNFTYFVERKQITLFAEKSKGKRHNLMIEERMSERAS